MPLMRLLSVAPTATPTVGAAATPSTPGASGAAASNSDTGVAPPATMSVSWLLASYLAVAVGFVLAIGLKAWRNPAAFEAATGISAFAPMYLLAQAIERLLDPFTAFVKAEAPAKNGNAKTKVTKAQATHQRNEAIKERHAQRAAEWQAVVDQIRKNTALIAWAAASVLAMLACGAFGIYLMRTIGFKGVPADVDILITGLAIGSGTKPLHDLISNLQSSSDNKQDPSEKQSA